MGAKSRRGLSRRERQIMEVLYRTGEATVAQIRAELRDPPSYSAVRTTTHILEQKGHLRHSRKGRSYRYSPVTPRREAMRGAVRQLLRTYFDNSLEQAVTAMVALHGKDLSAKDLARLQKAVRDQGRRRPAQ